MNFITKIILKIRDKLIKQNYDNIVLSQNQALLQFDMGLKKDTVENNQKEDFIKPIEKSGSILINDNNKTKSSISSSLSLSLTSLISSISTSFDDSKAEDNNISLLQDIDKEEENDYDYDYDYDDYFYKLLEKFSLDKFHYNNYIDDLDQIFVFQKKIDLNILKKFEFQAYDISYILSSILKIIEEKLDMNICVWQVCENEKEQHLDNWQYNLSIFTDICNYITINKFIFVRSYSTNYNFRINQSIYKKIKSIQKEEDVMKFVDNNKKEILDKYYKYYKLEIKSEDSTKYINTKYISWRASLMQEKPLPDYSGKINVLF